MYRTSNDGLLTKNTTSSADSTFNLNGAVLTSNLQPFLDQTSTNLPFNGHTSSGQPLLQQLVPELIASSSSTATDKVLKKSTTVKMPPRKRLTNNSFLQQSLSLNNRAIQLKRDKLRLEKKKVAVLETIACELTTIRSVLCITSNLNIVNTADHETVAKQAEV